MSTTDSSATARLVARFRETRDEHAFRELYRSESARLFGFLVRLTRDRTQAEDLFQETWLRVVRLLDSYRAESSFATWLSGIGLNCWRERRRQQGQLVELDQLQRPSAAAPSPEQLIDLERAVGALPEGFRIAIVLHDVEGWTHEEIARALGHDLGTSKSQLSRARERLRVLLSGNEETA